MKLCTTPALAIDGLLFDGMTIAVGGFGLCGIPTALIAAIRDSGVRDLTVVSNNMGVDGKGLGLLLESGQVSKAISSYVGENRRFAQQYLDGTLEVEFNPQGTLAERLRAGGSGIPAFYTRTGVGTVVAEGKPTAEFDGITYVQEKALLPDLSVVHARVGDHFGNLRYRLAARNFNPLVAMAGRVTIAEVEQVVEAIDPELIQSPGIYVSHVVHVPDAVKDIEQRTVRPRVMEVVR